MENIFLKLKERHRVYPASWEDFWVRFIRGKAEFNTKIDGTGATGNIYEALFLQEEQYPLLLLNKQLKKSDIIEILNEELWLSEEAADEIVSRLKSAAGNHEARKAELVKYFQDTVDKLNQAYALGLSF